MAADFMVDLETASTRGNAAILSIGVVRFSLHDGWVQDPFYVNVSRKDCAAHGLHVCPDTLRWWEAQSQEARDALQTPPPVGLATALFQFRGYVQMSSGTNRRLWGNGATFDNIILRSAFEAVDMQFPFHFSQDRDVRTLVDLGRKFGIHHKKAGGFDGTRHHALDDATHQANYCASIFRDLKRRIDS